MRAKSRLKYQQFLREQSERNERNKSLVRALERIDQQAATLAARSERLKILKVNERFCPSNGSPEFLQCFANGPFDYKLRIISFVDNG